MEYIMSIRKTHVAESVSDDATSDHDQHRLQAIHRDLTAECAVLTCALWVIENDSEPERVAVAVAALHPAIARLNRIIDRLDQYHLSTVDRAALTARLEAEGAFCELRS